MAGVSKLIPFMGEMVTIKEAAKRLGVTHQAILNRLKNWGNAEHPPKKEKQPRKFNYYGELLTIAEIAERCGVKEFTIYHRILKTGSPELDETYIYDKKHTVNGQDVTINQLSELTGYKNSSIYVKISTGITAQAIYDAAMAKAEKLLPEIEKLTNEQNTHLFKKINYENSK